MAGNCKPGPLCGYLTTTVIDDGTMCRAESPKPGPLGLDLFGVSKSEQELEDKYPFLKPVMKTLRDEEDVRAEIARVASGYKDSLRWREDTDNVVKCSRFVDDVLKEVFAGSHAHGQKSPPHIGGTRSKWAYELDKGGSAGWTHDAAVWLKGKRDNPLIAGDWAGSGDIPNWRVVSGGPANAMPGDIIAENIFYWDASGHVGIVVGTKETASADSTATPAGKITISDYGFRADTDSRKYGHASECTVRRFYLP